MTDMKNSYRRNIDPERDSPFIWMIVVGLLTLVATAIFLYLWAHQPRHAWFKMSPVTEVVYADRGSQ